MRSRVLFALLVVGPAAGCGPDPNKEYPLRVAVTLDGAPLREGTVYITPADGRGVAGGELVESKLEAKTVAGTHRVEVRAYKAPPGAKLPPGAKPGLLVPDPFVNYIPARYNSASDLTVTVTPDGPNDFTLDLKSR